MKYMVLLLCFVAGLAVFSDAEDACYNITKKKCSAVNQDQLTAAECTAKYSGAHEVKDLLHKYISQHISLNYHYLLMATHFGNHELNRAGFEKLYRKLADKAWEDAIDLIKYMNKRGVDIDFFSYGGEVYSGTQPKTFQLSEVESLSTALDLHKKLANAGHNIHAEVTKRHNGYHDAEVMSYLEKHHVHEHAEAIRALSGHVNDLHNIVEKGSDLALSIHMFDEYLLKSL